MLIANYYSLDSQQVGGPIPMQTDNLEFATLQAKAVTGFSVIVESRHFVLLGDGIKRLVIGYD